MSEVSMKNLEIDGEKTIQIDGKYYWDVPQFAKLTDRKEGSIRLMCNKGNRIRKLKSIHIVGRLLIEAEELLNFPFVVCGRPAEMGAFIENYYLENGELLKSEKIFKP